LFKPGDRIEYRSTAFETIKLYYGIVVKSDPVDTIVFWDDDQKELGCATNQCRLIKRKLRRKLPDWF